MEKDKNRKKILIIDDSPEAIALLDNALSKQYKRQVALGSKEALKLLTEIQEVPDLILIDVMMPDMNGYQVCQQIKTYENLKDIPVIFLSALSEMKDKVMAFENGGVDYIQKPFEIEEVRARVATHIKLHDLQKKLMKYNHHLNQLVEEKTREISESQIATIYALVKLSEARDMDTGTHIDRVPEYCKYIAVRLKSRAKYKDYITDKYIENIYKASPLHDIGKVGISDAILLKPGRLTAEEFEIMKTHTTIGANTLDQVGKRYPNNQFIDMGTSIALYHHEKWDGSGYPHGLVGEEVPLSARIMAIADVYDAMRSKRVYKERYSHEKCVDIILEGSGFHFDPEIADIFSECEKEFDRIYNNY
jgi:putative two-component system response regulator